MQAIYVEQSRRIPVRAQVDVLVVGSGPAGFAASVMAARLGANTLLVDVCGMVGGIATAGLMSHFTGSVKSNFYTELLDRMAERNLGALRAQRTVTIDPEQLRTLCYDMLEEAGASLLLYTMACEAIVESGRVTGVILQNKSGRSAVFAKVVIDATGDGDIAAMAGVPFQLGREQDGKMQPVSIMFKVGGVDYDHAVFPGGFESLVYTDKGELQAMAREKLRHPAGHVLLYRSTLPGIVTCNMTNCVDIDGTKAEDLTRGEIACRRQISEIVGFLRAYVPGYADCYLVSSASLLGVRETRHFEGLYTLTEEDILAKTLFEDWIVREARFNFDVHNITGAGLDVTGAQDKFPKDNYYSIPYRCLLPKGVDGLLLAGRNISGTHLAHSNYRVMPICVAMGEAAGVAAALASAHGITPKQVPAADIQQIIK